MKKKDGFFRRILNAIFFRKRNDKSQSEEKDASDTVQSQMQQSDLDEEKKISIEADHRDAKAEEKRTVIEPDNGISGTTAILQDKQLKQAEKKKESKKFIWQRHSGTYKGERDIIIGFDFGTACTKVILQDKQLKKAFAVSFKGITTETNPYLLPTRLFVNPDGSISLKQGQTEVTNLKMKFIQNPNRIIELNAEKNFTSQDIVSAYIGLVLTEICNWFWTTRLREYKHLHINWELNIGLSSRDYDDIDLNNRMRSVALTGWNLTLNSSKQISVSDIAEARKITESQIEKNICDADKEQLHPENINPIPEIIAEVIGYARSQMRHNGMYMLIDIGASTFDVSTFVLSDQQYHDIYSILYAEVEKMGTFYLHKYRIHNYQIYKTRNRINTNLHQHIYSCDATSRIPNSIYDYFENLTPEDRKNLIKIDREFLRKCSQLVRIVIRETRNYQNPIAYEWENGLPVFLCGGGSKITLYKAVLRHAENALRNTHYNVNLIRKVLPMPQNLETNDIPPNDYHRMAVSYGLSFSEVDIGRIIPQREVPPIEIPQPINADIDAWFVGPEQT